MLHQWARRSARNDDDDGSLIRSAHTHTHIQSRPSAPTKRTRAHTLICGQDKIKNTRIAAGKQGRRSVLDKLNLMCQLFVDLSPVRRAGRWRMCVCVQNSEWRIFIWQTTRPDQTRAHTHTHLICQEMLMSTAICACIIWDYLRGEFKSVIPVHLINRHVINSFCKLC